VTTQADAARANVRTIVHVDMDAFFASVELLRRPELRGTPVIVGGAGRRGVVAAASYEARSYGVHSAMPSARAKRLCPEAVFLAGDHALYREVSTRIMAVMARFTPLIEPLSLDEAFLDVTAARRLFGDGPAIAAALRSAIFEEEGLWCSAGVATNKFVAKLASEEAKPKPSRRGPIPGSGVFVVAPGAEISFLHPLPARALWGVGAATMAKLDRLGVVTVGDIAALPLTALISGVGVAVGNHLHALAHARDERSVEPHQRAKSMSHEETYPFDRFERADLERDIVRMSDSVASRLRRAAVVARTVTIKVRFGDFRTITRSLTLDAATDSGTRIARTARLLLDEIDVSTGIRLLGVGATGLDDEAPEQLSLDALAADDREEWRKANGAVDDIRERFGTTAIGPAALIDPEKGIDTGTGNENPWG